MKQALSAALLAIAVTANDNYDYKYDSYNPRSESTYDSYSGPSRYTSSYQPRRNDYSTPYGAPADYEQNYDSYGTQPYGTGYSPYSQ